MSGPARNTRGASSRQPPATPSGAPRATPAGVGPALAALCCRCAAGVDQGFDCVGGNFGTLTKKKCARCVKGRHPCEPLPPHLRGEYVTARNAYDSLAEIDDDDDDSQADRATHVQTIKDFKDLLKAYHTNKNKVTGEASTPLNRLAGAAHSALDQEKVVELQRIRRALTALVAVGQEMVRGTGGSTERSDRIMAGGEFFEDGGEAEEAEEEEELDELDE